MFGYRATQQTLAKLKERRTPTLAHGAGADPAPTTIWGYAYGFYRHAALLAGMQLDLFSELGAGPRSAAELGLALQIEPARLERLLDALVVAELLSTDGDRYALTAEAGAYLVRGQPGHLGDAQGLWREHWLAALRTADSLRTGRTPPGAEPVAMADCELSVFLRGLHPGAMSPGHALVNILGLGRNHHLLEVSGSSAGLALAACEACPQLRATVVAAPRVADRARARIARSPAHDRLEVLGLEIAAAPLQGAFDIAVLANTLQALGPEDARRAVHHVARAIVPGGAVHVLGWMLGDCGLKPAHAVLHNLLYLNLFEAGAAHPASEVRRWLEEAGLADVVRADPPAGAGGQGFVMLSGRRPGTRAGRPGLGRAPR